MRRQNEILNNMRKIPVVLIIIWTLFFFQYSYGQKSNNANKEKTVKQTNKLVGTWRLIEYTDLDTLTHTWTYPYGKNPRGYFTYTSTNIVNLNISSDVPLLLTEDSVKKSSISCYDFIEKYSFGYFGTYSVDWKKSIVTHHVKGGSVPWYIDTEQPRLFIMKGDTLIIGDNKKKRRVLVKAD